MMKIEVYGDALRLLRHFLEYGERNMAAVADAMYYDHMGFKNRLKQLRKAYEAGIGERY